MSLELSKTLVDWAQVLGAFFSLVALVLALFALFRSRHDLVEERRSAHELQILRDIGEQFGGFLQKQWRTVTDAEVLEIRMLKSSGMSLDEHERALTSRLLMLPERDFPMTRSALGMTVPGEVQDKFEKALRTYLTATAGTLGATMPHEDREAWIARNMISSGARRVFVIQTREHHSIIRDELDAAIRSRTSTASRAAARQRRSRRG